MVGQKTCMQNKVINVFSECQKNKKVKIWTHQEGVSIKDIINLDWSGKVNPRVGYWHILIGYSQNALIIRY